MSETTVDRLGERLAEYAQRTSVRSLMVIAHGGEPLLVGPAKLRQFFSAIKKHLSDAGCRVNFGLQTNGLLVDEEVIHVLQEFGVHAGVSLDGPPTMNDRFRVDKQGKGTAERTIRGAQMLQSPVSGASVFGGFLCVADPTVSPADQLAFFESLNAGFIDFLLPDFNHDTQPVVHRNGAFGSWLVALFDLWYDSGTSLEIRTFTVLLQLVLGGKRGYDSFGATSKAVVVVETDGTFHALDVLKTAYDGATQTGLTLDENTFMEVLQQPLVIALASKATAAPTTCMSCEIFDVCGAGYLPHRYSQATGFDNVSIYCEDIQLLVSHIAQRSLSGLPREQPEALRERLEQLSARELVPHRAT